MHVNEECRAQSYFTAHNFVERREEASATYRGTTLWNGTNWPRICLYVSVFLVSIRCNVIVIYPFDSICVQRPSFVLRCPLLFLTFPLAGSPEPLLGSAAPAPHHNPPQNCKNFLLNGGESFIHEEGKL